MWGDECYYSIEGECEFFQDWLKQTKDEVSIIRYRHMHQKAILHLVDFKWHLCVYFLQRSVQIRL